MIVYEERMAVAASPRSLTRVTSRPELAMMSRPSSALVPSILTTMGRILSGRSLGGQHEAARGDVAAEYAAEDVHEHLLDVGVGEHDFERLGDFLLVGATADVEEVGGSGSGGVGDVHGGHGEPAPLTMQPMSPSSLT